MASRANSHKLSKSNFILYSNNVSPSSTSWMSYTFFFSVSSHKKTKDKLLSRALILDATASLSLRSKVNFSLVTWATVSLGYLRIKKQETFVKHSRYSLLLGHEVPLEGESSFSCDKLGHDDIVWFVQTLDFVESVG